MTMISRLIFPETLVFQPRSMWHI